MRWTKGRHAFIAVSYTHLDVYKRQAVKQVQRYIRLNELVPDLMKLMDEKKLGFTTAVELSYIGKKNQNYIAVAIDSQQSSPSQAQAKRMRELDEKKLLNGDVIDGIMMEDKKEVDKVILTGAEPVSYTHLDVYKRQVLEHIGAAAGVFADYNACRLVVAIALAEHIVIPAQKATNLVGMVGSQINTSFTTEAIGSKILSHYSFSSFKE